MDRERADAFLRLLAEAELRRLTAHRRDSGMDGEVALRVEVVPPLSQGTAWSELLAAGRSVEVRAIGPLHWADVSAS